jgi:ABC-type lipoprotein release transport system permease subunit
MWLVQLAWKNLWRNRGRTIITIAAVGFATIISVITESLKEGIFNNLIKNVVSSYTGHIQIHQKGYQDEQIIDNSFIPKKELEEKIKIDKDVQYITARLETFSLISSGEDTRGCFILGINPSVEDSISQLKNKISAGNYLTSNDNGMIMAEGLAEKLKVHLGDTVILIGQGYHGNSAAGKIKIKGLVKLGSPKLNDRLIYMSLHATQTLFAADSLATSWVLLLGENADPEKTIIPLKNIIGDKYEAMTWGEIMPDIKQHIGTDSNNMKVVQFILYLLVSFGIFSTLLIMMVERRQENGMLLALGMTKFRLQILMMAESLLTVMLGSVVGMILSTPVVWYLRTNPIRIGGDAADAYKKFGFEPIFPAAYELKIFLSQGLMVFVIGIVLSLYPLWAVMRMNALNAMKK